MPYIYHCITLTSLDSKLERFVLCQVICMNVWEDAFHESVLHTGPGVFIKLTALPCHILPQYYAANLHERRDFFLTEKRHIKG